MIINQIDYQPWNDALQANPYSWRSTLPAKQHQESIEIHGLNQLMELYAQRPVLEGSSHGDPEVVRWDDCGNKKKKRNTPVNMHLLRKPHGAAWGRWGRPRFKVQETIT